MENTHDVHVGTALLTAGDVFLDKAVVVGAEFFPHPRGEEILREVTAVCVHIIISLRRRIP